MAMATFVPEAAQEAVAQVVDYVCQEIVGGLFRQEEWWETVQFFQKDIPMSAYYILAKCWIIDLQLMTTDNWLELVETMIPLEDKFAANNDVAKTYLKTMRLLRMQLILSHFRGKELTDKSRMNSSLKAIERDKFAFDLLKKFIEMEKGLRDVAINQKPLSLDYFASKVLRMYLPQLMISLNRLKRPASLCVSHTAPEGKATKNLKKNLSTTFSTREGPGRTSLIEIDDTSSNNFDEPGSAPFSCERESRVWPSHHFDELDDVKCPAIIKNDKENSREAMRKLRSARKHLREDFADPLQEIRDVARQAKRSKTTSTLYEKKNTARSLDFDDSSVSEAEGPKLSSVPTKMTFSQAAPAVKKAATTVARLPGTRLVWTADEKNAVRQGIIRYGFGKWSKIKSEYAEILRYRTAVNVKDCARSMKLAGELVFEESGIGQGPDDVEK